MSGTTIPTVTTGIDSIDSLLNAYIAIDQQKKQNAWQAANDAQQANMRAVELQQNINAQIAAAQVARGQVPGQPAGFTLTPIELAILAFVGIAGVLWMAR